MNGVREGKTPTIMTEKKKDLLFYIVAISLPVLQFCIFYIGVNFNSLLLAFQEYDVASGSYRLCGFTNLSNVWEEFFNTFLLKNGFFNSLKVWALTTVISLPLSLLFSFFIYKKFPLKNFFKVALFLPSVISGMVTVVIYLYFVERAIPGMAEKLFGYEMVGWLGNVDTQFGAVLFYNIFYSFGGYILLFVGAMNSVDPSVSEAGALDGVSGLREFWYIVFPKVYPTFCTFLVLSVAGIFTNQFSLYSFYGIEASNNVMTFGYYLYAITSVATTAEYPRIAAIGVLMTLFVIPITLLVKYVLGKIGPKEDAV